MANPIQNERMQKAYKKLFIIGGVIIYILLLLMILKTLEYKADVTHFREGWDTAIAYGMTHFFMLSKGMFSALIKNFFMIFIFSLLGVVAIWGVLIERDMRRHDNPDTVHGKAHFLNLKELDEYNMKRTDPIGYTRNDGPNNMLLSKDISLAIDNRNTRRNCNILCIGGSGAGKSRFFISPNVLQYNANFIITDPSGEMLYDYGKALENNGYAVKVFNLVDVYNGNRYNPFHYIHTEKDAFILTNTLIKNTTGDNKGGDPFWEKSEQLLISALVLYLWHTEPEEKQTFSRLVDLISEAQVDENDANVQSPLDIRFEELEAEDPENLAVKQYKKFKLGAGKTLKSILISVGVRLQSFDLSDIKYLTSADEMHFETFADTRQALFIIIPTADTTFNFIVSLLYSQLFMTLYDYCETTCQYGWKAYIPMQTHYRHKKHDKKGRKDPASSGKEILKVIQADGKAASKKSKKDMSLFVKAVKSGKGVSVKHNKEKGLYEIYVTYKNSAGEKVTELIGWRGDVDEKLKNNFLHRLPQIKMEPCGRACPNHVRFLLDEFANIGQIPEFDQKLATIRKYEISCAIVLQAISQMQEIYDKKWNTIAGNCDTKLILGTDDTETNEWVTKTTGKQTVRTMSSSIQDGDKGGSESFQTSGEELITASDLTLMGEDECLVRIRGVPPYFGKKYEITEHPNYKYAHALEGMFESQGHRPDDDESYLPLRLRGKNKAIADAAKASAEGIKGDKEIKDLADKRRQEAEEAKEKVRKAKNDRNKNENAARKKDADEAKKELKETKPEAGTPVTDEKMKQFLADNGLSENPTQEEVEKAATEYVELYMPEEMEIADYQLFEQ